MRTLAALPIAVCLLQAQDPGAPLKNPPSLIRPGEQHPSVAPPALLTPGSPAPAEPAAPADHPVAQPRISGTPGTPAIYSYFDGEPGCDHAYLNGSFWEHIDAGNISIAASPRDNGEKLIISVAVSNNGQRPVDVLPNRVTATLVEPRTAELKWVDPANLVKSIQRRARWANAFEQMGANMQQQQVQTQSNTSGRVNTNSDYYNVYGQQVGYGQGRGTYSEQTTITTTMPNWAAQQQAQANIQRRMAGAADATQAIAVYSLKPQTISGGQLVIGDVYFDRDRAIGKKHRMIVRVAVGDSIFEFSFARQ